jgi:hypothetical protein
MPDESSKATEELIRSLTAVFLNVTFGLPIVLGVASWNVFSVFVKKRGQKENLADIFDSALSGWAAGENLSDDLYRGIVAATDIIELHGLKVDEVALLGVDPHRASDEVKERSRTQHEQLSDAELAICDRAIFELYSVMSELREDMAPLKTAVELANLRATLATHDIVARRDREEAARGHQEIAAIVARAQQQLATELAIRANAELGRSLLVESRATKMLLAGLTHDWRRDIQRIVGQIVAFCDEHPSLLALAERLGTVDFDGQYESIRNELAGLELNSALPALRAVERAIDDSEIGPRIARPMVITRLTRRLIDEIESPRYRWFVGISGDWGSGKSRLMDVVAGTLGSVDDLFAYLRLDPGKPLAESLLQQLRDEWDIDFAGVSTLQTWLKNDNRRLIVILDNLENAIRSRPSLLRELQDFVRRNTHRPGIRWLVAIDQSRLGSVLTRELNEFWRTYGVSAAANDSPVLDGWLDLHQLNVRDRPGIRILRQAATSVSQADVDELELDVTRFGYSGLYFADPLPAWLQVERGAQAGLIDPHQSTVIAEYWALRRESLLARGFSQVELDESVAAVAAAFAGADLPELAEESAVQAVMTASRVASLRQRARAEEIVGALVDSGLLERDPNRLPFVVTPGLELFWANFMAPHVLAQSKQNRLGASAIVDKLRPWQRRSDEGDWLAEAVVQFVLGDLPVTPDRVSTTRKVWALWLDDVELRNTPIWSAAARGSEELQGAVGEWVAQNGPSPTDPHELFLFVRFVAMASNDSLGGIQRIAALQQAYPQIGEAGLGSYLAYAMRRAIGLLDLRDGEVHIAALSGLVGVEASGAAEAIVANLVSAGWDDDSTSWLRSIMSFLSLSKRAEGETYFAAGKVVEGPDRWAPQLFWQFLVDAVINQVFASYGLGALSELDAAGWMLSGSQDVVSRRVEGRIRRTINVCLGRRYRRREGALSEDFLTLISGLIEGTALSTSIEDQRSRALFALRHTELTGDGTTAIVLDEELIPSLRALANDDYIRRNFAKIIEPMMLANNLA